MKQLFTISESITLVLTTEKAINDFYKSLNELSPIWYEREYQRLNKWLNEHPCDSYEEWLEQMEIRDRLDQLYVLSGRKANDVEHLHQLEEKLDKLNPNSKEYIEIWDYYSDFHKDVYGCRP